MGFQQTNTQSSNLVVLSNKVVLFIYKFVMLINHYHLLSGPLRFEIDGNYGEESCVELLKQWKCTRSNITIIDLLRKEMKEVCNVDILS
jgi:hypothetical protein